MEIVQLREANEQLAGEIDVLINQLNDDKHCTLEDLQALTTSPMAELWVVREEGHIVGAATLTLSHRIAGISSRIEDVIIDAGQRGKGFGKALCKKVIERAKERGATRVLLTSRPSRDVANKLYPSLGFEKYDTNNYRMKL